MNFDSAFLHEEMLRVLSSRRKHPSPPTMSIILREVLQLQEALEAHDHERIRKECLDLASIALRFATEIHNKP